MSTEVGLSAEQRQRVDGYRKRLEDAPTWEALPYDDALDALAIIDQLDAIVREQVERENRLAHALDDVTARAEQAEAAEMDLNGRLAERGYRIQVLEAALLKAGLVLAALTTCDLASYVKATVVDTERQVRVALAAQEES